MYKLVINCHELIHLKLYCILIFPGFNDCYIMVGPDGTVLEYYHYGSINVEFMSFLCWH